MASVASQEPLVRASVRAGMVAGFLPVIAFWVFHTIWIVNVPAVLAEGVLWAVAAGAAVGWAFHHLHAHGVISADWRGGVLFALLLWSLLVPYELVGLAFGPFTHLTRPVELAAIAPSGFLGVPVAATVAWVLTRHARATIALALATLAAHFMLGGSLVYFGGRGILLILFFGMLPTYAVAGLVLVHVRSRLLQAQITMHAPKEVIP